ncbi:MAG: 3-deoxy-7-phosphoheptulonate synthase [Spirochaetes bacterium]|nr:3-deoxy-7-phosphoheptulonate synthase [Spirochaetota bacterium]
MILIFSGDAKEKDIDNAVKKIEAIGFHPHISRGALRTIVGITGDDRAIPEEEFNQLPGVEQILHVLKPYKLASRDFHPDDTVIKVNEKLIGKGTFTVIAGPCSVEDSEQVETIAAFLESLKLKFIRGGAFKPRSSPYSFQGLGEDGLKILRHSADRHGLAVVTEVLSAHDVELVGRYTDIFQVGARNMQNFALLKALGRVKKPILLKRSMMAKVEEFLLSAEYIMKEGNSDVILCERGIRTFETATRNTLDIAAIPVIKRFSHLPVIIDPSHSMGDWHYVNPASLASIAAGADGLIIEVHPDPLLAKSDGKQSLSPDRFKNLFKQLEKISKVLEIDIQ